MARMIAICWLTLLALTALARAQAEDGPIPFVFTQTASRASLGTGDLVLDGIGEASTYLSDRPERTLKGKLDNLELVQAWAHPGATGVAARLFEGETLIAEIKLLGASYADGAMRYRIEGAPTGQSREIAPARLEIDLNGCITGCSKTCPFNFSRVFFNQLVPCKP